MWNEPISQWDPKAKPLRAVELWALEYMQSLPLEKRAKEEVSEHFGWGMDTVEEIWERLTYWKLIKGDKHE